MLRERELIESLSYLAETRIPLPLAQAQLHRGINLVLHISAALLLLRLLRTLRLKGALATSLVFAVHPAVVQTLFWPGYRDELFGLVLILSALNCGIRDRNQFENLLCWLLTALACLVHTAGLFIPLILALIVFLQKGTLQLNHYNRVLPLLCIALFTGAAIHAGASTSDSAPLPVHLAINHAAENIVFFYNQTLIADTHALFYPYDSVTVQQNSLLFSLLPFCSVLPFYALAFIQWNTGWSRGILLGLSAFLCLLLRASSTKVPTRTAAPPTRHTDCTSPYSPDRLGRAGSRRVVEHVQERARSGQLHSH